MMRSIIESSLNLRFLVLVLAATMLFFGGAQLRHMPVDVLPEFAPPYVEVQTEALGLSAAEVEMLISLNLEELLHGLPWLQSMHSTSVPGLSSVVLIFEPGTDIMRARQLVAERLTSAHMLPNVSKPPVILQPLSATSRVMMVGLSSKTVSPIEMSVIARWTVRPALLSVPGVANVSIWGQRERQLQVQVDPQRLQAHDVTLDQVIRTAGDALWVSPLSFLNASTPGTGGFIDTPQQRLELRHILPITTPEDLAHVPIAGTEGLRLGDVSSVVEDHQLLIGDAILKTNNPGNLLLVVEKFPGANTLDVTRGLEARLNALRPGLQGIEIDTSIFRPASFIEMGLDNLSMALLIGALLVVLVFLAFFFQWRTVLICVVAIPLSLVTALFVLYVRGATANVMVLAGLMIALVAVIDDAIIDVENIARRLHQHRVKGTNKSSVAIIIEALLEMRGTAAYAVLIMLLAILPILFMGGVLGRFFQPMVSAYALAVVASMVVALLVTPVLSVLLFSDTTFQRHQSPLVAWLQRGYSKALWRTMGKPYLAYSIIAVLVVAGLLAVPFLGRKLMPAFQEPDVLIQWDTVPGTSHPEMVRLVSQARDELLAIPGVRNFGSHIGRAVLGDQLVDINSAQLWLSIHPAADYDATIAAIQNTIDGYPGLVRNVQTYLQQTISQVLTGASTAVVVRVYGPEFHILREKAEEIRQAISGIEGVVDLHTELQIEQPYVEVEVDLAKAEAYGIKPGDVRRAAATMMNGIHVNNLFEEQKVFDVMVWSIPETRNSLTDLRELLIDTPDGGQIRLQEVADVRVVPTLTKINREAISRRIDVGFNVRGRDFDTVANEVEQRLQQIEFPLEYRAELLGEYTEQEATQNRMLAVAIAALIAIILLLQAAFHSWRLAFLLFLTFPVALLGGVVAILISGGTISLGSLVGFFAILAITARNSIMLIRRYQDLQQKEGESFGPMLVLRGAQERVGPILVTIVATALALVPLVAAGNLPGYEVAYPLAVVILGGLVTSLVLNLFVVPALYLRFGSGTTPDETANLY